ncbi:MAG: hypothetical protein ACRDWW_03070, partial [Acidimicrobiales bacterium]
VVGYAAVEHFAQLGGWEVVGLSRRIPDLVEGANLVSLDIADRDACSRLAGDHPDTTHIVYAALFEKPGLIPGWLEEDQMRTNEAMLANLMGPLLEAASGLLHVSLLQGTKAYGVHVEPMAVPARERWDRHPHPNFYWLQEDYLRQEQEGRPWALTIWRPQVIFGRALSANMNPIPALGVYGAVLREQGQPLHYPGGEWGFVFEGVDADLLAHALAWAAVSPAAANQTFNITNGDVMVWRNVWPAIAAALGMEVGQDRPISFVSEAAAWQPVWESVVERRGLRAPRSLPSFVGQSFDYMDFLMAHGAGGPLPPALVSTIKLRQAGFAECEDSEDMLARWFARFQRERLLPMPA